MFSRYGCHQAIAMSGGWSRSRNLRLLSHLALALGLVLAFGAGTASAAKQAIDYFGTEAGSGTLGGEFDKPQGVAVNNSGAGPADKGDVYVVDTGNSRIQRFGRSDNGTPADPADDTYPFISAWGAGVDSASGNNGYQICTVASQCQAGISSAGNGALAYAFVPGFGDAGASGIALDQDSGEVYVTDALNFRINVYTGDGTFLRSFGYDVVASGPGQVAAPNERQQLTVKASGGKFSLAFAGKSTGPMGRGRREAGSTTIELFESIEGTFAVGQSISGQGIAPGTTITALEGERLKISKAATGSASSEPISVNNFLYDASADEVEDSLNALPSIGGVGGSVTVTGGPGSESGATPYAIEFGGTLAEEDVGLINSSKDLTIGAGTAAATISTLVGGGAYEVCVAAPGDICRKGSVGSNVGEIGGVIGNVTRPSTGLTVTPPDGDPTSGRVFLADPGNGRIDVYDLDGSSPESFGTSVFSPTLGRGPRDVAVDSRGIVYGYTEFDDHTTQIERYDSQNANGLGVGFLAPIALPSNSVGSIAVDPDSDGAGPDADVLYVAQGGDAVLQFGPLNAPGLTTPPAAVDDEHGTTSKLFNIGGLSLDESDGRLYVASQNGAGQNAHGVYVLDNPSPPPTASLDSLSGITPTSVTAHATINPNGPPALSYHLEYSTDGTSWKSGPNVVLGSQKTPQVVEATLDPPGGGLEPNTLYHLRLVAKRLLLDPVIAPELTFTTLGAVPGVESTGSPVRTATTARLDSRLNPRGSATTYHFEYGTQGPCEVNPCVATEAHDAGTGKEVELVSQQLTGLQPNTTYHYRVVADNGNAGSPSFGADVTLTTLPSDAPLSHGHLSGPAGSDRAWEQVNQPDTGGNQVFTALGYAEEGNRAMFRIAGGTPDSNTGSLFALFFSERSSSGWQVKQITPQRSELIAADWEQTAGSNDLSSIVSANTEFTTGEAAVWRFDPNGQPAKLFQRNSQQQYGGVVGLSADGTRAVVLVAGAVDPAYPTAAQNLYDVSSGTPHLVSILPNGQVPSCGVQAPTQPTHWVSADGSLTFFTSRGSDCGSQSQLYMRDVEGEETTLISGPRISGPGCGAAFLKATPNAAFFWTQSHLTAEDTSPAACGGVASGDVYRYDLDDSSLECVTCVVPGLAADVVINPGSDGGAVAEIAVAEDGSRVYFKSQKRLLPGAPKDGEFGAYRVNVASADLAYVGAIGGRPIGQTASAGNALSADGSVITFRSGAAGLNALGGQQNGGSSQYYRYDDRDRSLICVSCPADGSLPLGDVSEDSSGGRLLVAASADGNTVAFATSTPLVSADLNTAPASQEAEAGTDVYEWRDGRPFLVSDGLTNWAKESGPKLSGMSASGRDIFFLAAAQYTPDALDAYQRLYDARIGGGFEFPQPPKPCPLEVCQGTPKGPPEEAVPGSSVIAGPGNAAQSPASCRKGKVRRKGRCVAKKPSRKHPHKKANHGRRTSR